MGKSPAQENHEPSALWKHILKVRVAAIQIKAQLTAFFRVPVFVQIEHARQLAVAVVTKLIDMPGVESARRIAGEMTFEFEQPELQSSVEPQPQLFELIQKRSLRLTGCRLLYPADFVAPNIR